MTDDEDLSDFEDKMRALEEAIKRDEEAFYGKKTIEEAYNPKNVGTLENPDGAAKITDQKGDTMQIHLRVEGNTIKDSKFTTDAYGPTIACGSVITEMVKGKTVEEAFGIEIKDIESVLGRLPAENVSSPVLAVNTLKAALEDYIHQEALNEST